MSRIAFVFLVLTSLALTVAAHRHHYRRGKHHATDVDWNKPAVDHKIIKAVNRDHKSTWKAGVNSRFAHATLSDVRSLLGTKLDGPRNLPELQIDVEDDLPTDYDVRDEFGKKCPGTLEIRDQSKCGSCWAFGAAEAMTDRWCIATDGLEQPRLSAADLLSCCGECGYGCDGGYPYLAWQYWTESGLVSGGPWSEHNATIDNGCYPYPFEPCEHHTNGTHYEQCPKDGYETPDCPNKCVPSSSEVWKDDKYYGNSSYAVTGVPNIMQELYDRGSIEVAFVVYEDFLSYKSGVYEHTHGAALGGHAVKLVGWGVEDGVNYWSIVNSWNIDWGYNGWFKIRRGTDECGIETSAVAGMPDLDR